MFSSVSSENWMNAVSIEIVLFQLKCRNFASMFHIAQGQHNLEYQNLSVASLT